MLVMAVKPPESNKLKFFIELVGLLQRSLCIMKLFLCPSLLSRYKN
ncbi:hypothetical protein [uncultured Gammaproteobacteria bacterium]|nr:hypothetical protein [uncultured Gammaproteobacteria bacterium]